MITYASFIAAFPEFTNSTTYPESQIDFWIPQAYMQLNARRFGAALDLAASLFVAHNVVLSARQVKSAAGGAIVGQPGAPMNNKAVGPVSAGYDTGVASIEGAGVYNTTSYGQRLYKMMQQYCSGPLYGPGRQYGQRYFNGFIGAGGRGRW